MDNKTNDFYNRLNKINFNAIKVFLTSLASPCFETELYKLAFPECKISISDPLELYQNHFLLFHTLYKMQNEFFKNNKYLHVHFMRTFLLDYPLKGKCRFYDEYSGMFCSDNCCIDNNYCDFHLKYVGDNEIEELSARYFYFDVDNFYSLNKKTAEAFIKGTWETLSNFGEYKNSFRILDLPETADIEMIKNKFRILAKKYHPDRGEKSHEKFNEINRAYQLLIRLRTFDI